MAKRTIFYLRGCLLFLKHFAVMLGTYFFCDASIEPAQQRLELEVTKTINGTLQNAHGAEGDYELELRMKPTAAVNTVINTVITPKSGWLQFVGNTPAPFIRKMPGNLLTIDPSSYAPKVSSIST